MNFKIIILEGIIDKYRVVRVIRLFLKLGKCRAERVIKEREGGGGNNTVVLAHERATTLEISFLGPFFTPLEISS